MQYSKTINSGYRTVYQESLNRDLEIPLRIPHLSEKFRREVAKKFQKVAALIFKTVKLNSLLSKMLLMITLMNRFVKWLNDGSAASLIPNRDHCQESSPLHTSFFSFSF